jgi:hypothetical protein
LQMIQISQKDGAGLPPKLQEDTASECGAGSAV